MNIATLPSAGCSAEAERFGTPDFDNLELND